MERECADGAERQADGAAVEVLRGELARADAAIARTDTKASILLAVFGPIVAVGAAVLPRIPVSAPGRTALAGAFALFLLAVLVLLAVVRPHLRGSVFRDSKQMTDEDVDGFVDEIVEDPQRWYRQQLLTISRLGATKFRRVRLAVFYIGAGLLIAAFGLVSAQW